MKLAKFCLLLLVTMVSLDAVAQTAEEIIAKHIDAIGGKEKLSAINTVKFDVSVDVMGNAADGWLTVANGKGYRNESDFGGQKVIRVFTDKMAWAVNPFMGVNDAQPMTDEAFKMEHDQVYIVPFLDYAARGSKVELMGQEKAGNVNAYKIKMTNKDKVESIYFIDPATWYIVKTKNFTDFGGQKTETTIDYSDFKKTDYGWVVPYTSNIDFGGQFVLTSKIMKTEVNPAVDESIFAMKK